MLDVLYGPNLRSIIAQGSTLMKVHTFTGTSRLFACTTGQSGGNLLSKYAPWMAFKTIELRPDEPFQALKSANACRT